MGLRQQMQLEIETILGKKKFIYGGYEFKPKAPYGNYARDDTDFIYTDDKATLKVNTYIVRIVTPYKDFALENKVEGVFEKLDIPYRVIREEEFPQEKVMCVEWEVEILEPMGE